MFGQNRFDKNAAVKRIAGRDRHTLIDFHPSSTLLGTIQVSAPYTCMGRRKYMRGERGRGENGGQIVTPAAAAAAPLLVALELPTAAVEEEGTASQR